MVSILDFWSEQFYLLLICQLPWYFLPSPVSTGLLVQEMKGKIDFQDGSHGNHLGFLILKILAIFLSMSQYFLPSFKSNGLQVQKKKCIIDFQDKGQLGFVIGTILAIFDQQVTQMLPTKFRVHWPRVKRRLLKQIVDTAQQRLTDHNSLPWALGASVS